jgi:tetratricopeptide (TPR) repeat protein
MVQPPAISAPPIVMAPVAPAPPAPTFAQAAPQARRRGRCRHRAAGRGQASHAGGLNACTVDDPSRDLALCRKLIDPAAPGAEGRAAAHIADRLTSAWSGDEDGALAAFDHAIAVAPELPRAYINRGLTRARRGEVQQGIADLDEAIRRAPHAARGYYNRGLLYRRAGDTARAKADEQRAVELDPRYQAAIP